MSAGKKVFMNRIVKVGIIGLGARTETLLASFVAMDDVEVVAVCDLMEERIQKIVGILEEKASSLAGSDDDQILIPYTVAQKIFNTQYVNAFYFTYENGDVSEEVIDKIDTSDSTTVLLVPFKK